MSREEAIADIQVALTEPAPEKQPESGVSDILTPPAELSPEKTPEEKKTEGEKTEEKKPEEKTEEKPEETTDLNLQSVWTGAATKIASLPTPGSILFPLSVLAIFFFVLVSVNGHTRLTWLWEVLTGQAALAVPTEGETPETPIPGNQPAPGNVGSPTLTNPFGLQQGFSLNLHPLSHVQEVL